MTDLGSCVLLFGGKGTRLTPLTKEIPKSLIPLNGRPVGLYILDFVRKLGFTKLIVIVSTETRHQFEEVFSGYDFGSTEAALCNQDRPDGTLAAITSVRDHIEGEIFGLVLGDEVFEYIPQIDLEQFRQSKYKMKAFLNESVTPENSGVFEIEAGKIISVEEKPKNPKSGLCYAGFALNKISIFDHVKEITPNGKGELDYMDMVLLMHELDLLDYALLKGSWFDIGESVSALEAAEDLVESRGINKLQ